MALWKRLGHGLHMVLAVAFLAGIFVGVPLYIWQTESQRRPAPPTCAEVADREHYARRRLTKDAVEFARCINDSDECVNSVTTDQLASGQQQVARLGQARARRCGQSTP